MCQMAISEAPVVCEWEAGQQWEGLRGVGEVWHCPLVSCLSVQVLKVLNSRSTVRELSLEDTKCLQQTLTQ